MSSPRSASLFSRLWNAAKQSDAGVHTVLNVGGGNKQIPLPPQYAGWVHLLLDIDPRGNPDIVCDARKLATLPAGTYDSVYCSHNLEHYYRHDARKVLAGFIHLLKADGFVFIRVPDMGELMRIVVNQGLDIDDVVYDSTAGPIAVRDVIYGYGVEIEKSGQDFYAHKTGFTQKSLNAFLEEAGFSKTFTTAANLEITAVGFLDEPTPFLRELFGLPADSKSV
ncbi:MAG: methyltransferase domain-containing protein [Betaproteobacteria bacterium]